MIEPGDLVVVVRACCPEARRQGLGWIFTAVEIGGLHGICCYCGTPFERQVLADHPLSWPSITCAPLAWLKKIPPLTEEESTEGVESVKC